MFAFSAVNIFNTNTIIINHVVIVYILGLKSFLLLQVFIRIQP